MPKEATHDQRVAYLRWRIEEWIRSGRTAQALADAAGLTGMTISDIRARRKGIGSRIGMPALQKAFGLDVFKLHEEAIRFSDQHPELVKAEGVTVEREDRYPNSAAAIVFARALKLPEESIASIAGIAMRSDRDLPPDEWLDLIRADASRRRLGLGGDLVNSPEDEAELARLEEGGRARIPKPLPPKPKKT